MEGRKMELVNRNFYRRSLIFAKCSSEQEEEGDGGKITAGLDSLCCVLPQGIVGLGR